MTAPSRIPARSVRSAELLAAPLIGFAFGWFLERGGLGHAPQAGRPVLSDRSHRVQGDVQRARDRDARRVLAGSVRPAGSRLVYVPETFVVPQSHRRPALRRRIRCWRAVSRHVLRGGRHRPARWAGVIAGMLARHPRVQRRCSTGSPGSTPARRWALTFTDLLGVSRGARGRVVTAVALAGFALAARIERVRRLMRESEACMRDRRGVSPVCGSRRSGTRSLRTGAGRRRDPAGEDHISAPELADRIMAASPRCTCSTCVRRASSSSCMSPAPQHASIETLA